MVYVVTELTQEKEFCDVGAELLITLGPFCVTGNPEIVNWIFVVIPDFRFSHHRSVLCTV